MALLRTILPKVKRVLGPHLAAKRYRLQRPQNAHPAWGCCYPAAEAVYHLWGKEHGFKPHYIRYRVNSKWIGTHWFLKKESRIIDPTVEQFTIPPDYSKAICTGFFTLKPSKRCREILEKVS
jgi:hypothetical protein